jgi:hypothetical protein
MGAGKEEAMTMKRAAVRAGLTAIVVGVVALVGILTLDTIETIQSSRTLYPDTTLEQQATAFLDHGGLSLSNLILDQREVYKPSEIEAWLYGKEKATENVRARAIACKETIKKYATVEGKTVIHIPLTATPHFTSEPCYFHDPSVRPNIRDVVMDGGRIRERIRSAMFGLLVLVVFTAIATFVMLSLLVYPHLGWRRISFSAAPLLGLSLGTIQWLRAENLESALIIAILGTVLFGPLILGGRELYRWIMRGFETEKRTR